jgi:RHS repeat-associated protein
VQWITAYGNNEGGCTPPDGKTTTERCDDPIKKDGGLDDPLVKSTLSLQTVKTYVGDDSSSSHLFYSYNFAYQNSPFYNCTDAVSNSPAYCAGNHLLTGITPTVYQNGMAHQLPGVTFSYTDPGTRKNKYEDTSHSVGGHNFRVETNWRYLDEYHDQSNGVGAIIGYHTAYNNSNGTPRTSDGDNRYDALFCVWHPGECSQSPFAPTYNKMWTQQVVTEITSSGKDSSASSLLPATTHYRYWLTKTAGTCAADSTGLTDCVGFGWMPSGYSSDWQDYYHGEFRGFGTVLITSPAGHLTTEKYYVTEGWNTPQSNPGNYLAGQLYERNVYEGSNVSDSKLLLKTVNTYAGTGSTAKTCSNSYASGTYKPCEVVLLSTKTTHYEKTGTANSNAPWVQQSYTYDDYDSSTGLIANKYHNLLSAVTTSSNAPTETQTWTYAPPTNTTVNGNTYYNVHVPTHTELVDSNNHKWQCQDFIYDEGVASGIPVPAAAWLTTSKTYSSCGNASTALTSYTAYDSDGNVVAAVDPLGVATPGLYSSNGCTLTTTPVIFTANWSAGRYSACTQYQQSSGLPTDSWNAFGHHSSTAYDATQGLLPISTTDFNNQVSTTAYSYDSNGNLTISSKLPGESSSYTARSTGKTNCTPSSTLPCFVIESNSALYETAVSRTFYDSQGRAVETISPGPDATHSMVTFTIYNDQDNSVFQSVPFRVASRTTWLDPNGATDDTGVAPEGTASYQDALGRVIKVVDPSGQQTRAVYGLGIVSGDSNTYATTTSIDENNHVDASFTDALGRARYGETYAGLYGGTLTVNARKTIQYNVLDAPTSVVVTDLAPQTGQTITSVTTTVQYDDLGRVTSLSDPDRGTHTSTYDAGGRLVADVSGTRTIGYSYDLLGRTGCIQDALPITEAHGACSSGANPFVQNTYDADPTGVSWGSSTYPIGRLTQSVATNYFPGPNYTQGIVTENMQYDLRGRLITQRMRISVSGGNLTFPTLPSYQQSLAYNSADQLTTTTTSSTPSGQGYTFTQSYDSTLGLLNGLSNTTVGTPTLAALIYNHPRGLLSAIVYKSSTGNDLAKLSLQYDTNLRPLSRTTTWLSASGSSGTISSDGVSYDPTGNVLSRVTNHAAVPGQSNSGGTETQLFCYDEHNRLIWGANTGSVPSGGSGTCGTGTPTTTFSNAGFNNTYVSTHLGQLWQGPLNGTGAQQQYLYCNSGHPHQLTGLAPAASNPTCASPGTTGYSASYDAWGNLNSRSYPANTTGNASYDGQDHLMRWDGLDSSSGTKKTEWYFYDGAGNRVLRRAATGTGDPVQTPAKITIYAFGLQEHVYQYTPATGGTSESVSHTDNTYYYTLGGTLIGILRGSSTLSTTYSLTDSLGSVVASFSNTDGSAGLLGNQLFGPYGNTRYSKGDLQTAKGFTGQYQDELTGLDYYHARYYDPVVGRFLSADSVQSNLEGLDPYAYVGGNPQTFTDPSGQVMQTEGGGSGGSLPRVSPPSARDSRPIPPRVLFPLWPTSPPLIHRPSPAQAVRGVPPVRPAPDRFGKIKLPSPSSDEGTRDSCEEMSGFKTGCAKPQVSTPFTKIVAYQKTQPTPGILVNLGGFGLSKLGIGTSYYLSSVSSPPLTACWPALACNDENQNSSKGQEESYHPGFGCSFTPETEVETQEGKEPIGTLQEGEKVWAYDPQTQRMQWQPIVHVFLNQDEDLVDLTLTTTWQDPKSNTSQTSSEVIHTNKKHPFLTIEQGFLPVGQIVVGMHVLRADGRVGMVTAWRMVPGSQLMYNLEVARVHTFTVGQGQWVVHNCASKIKAYIKHSVYNEARNKIGKKGVDKFIHAMENGIVGPKGEAGIKLISGAKVGNQYFNYEIKVKGKFGDYRFFGNEDDETGHIIFTKFGQGLH